MESTMLSIGASQMSILSISKSVNPFSTPPIAQLHRHHICTALAADFGGLRLIRCIEHEKGSFVRVVGHGDVSRSRCRFLFSAKSYSSGGIVGGGGGNAEGGGAEATEVAPGAADDPILNPDVIILGVGGMMCGGCAASVKKILESQPQVSLANVNLETETAVVWPESGVKVAPSWRKDTGEALAKHLTNCGFQSSLKDGGGGESE